MILDEFNEFADNVSVAAIASTALIGDVIDLGGTTQDIGNGEQVYLVIQTGDTEIITGGNAGTIEFQLVSDDAAAIAIDGSASIHFSTGALVTDDAAVNDSRLNIGGTIAIVALPWGTYERYLGILAVIATTTVTAGKINAFLTCTPAKWTATSDFT
jgi:hypothetical protein